MRTGSYEFPAGAFSIIYAHVRCEGRGRERRHLTARKKREEVAGCKRGVSFRTAYVKTGWDRNRSPGFSDRPNQCKQLDIAGNISFLRAVRRSTAKRAQTTTTTMTGYGVEGSWGCCAELP